MKTTWILFGFLLLLLVGCSTADSTLPQASAAAATAGANTQVVSESGVVEADVHKPTEAPPAETRTNTSIPEMAPSATSEPTPAPTSEPIPEPTPTMGPDDWQELPVLPVVSERVIEIYQRGQELGNNAGAYSKVGDCGATPAWFLGDFDGKAKHYSLGEYNELQGVIDSFRGSHKRTSLAAKSGFNASSMFATIWSDREYCLTNETPLACEYREHRPILALVALGTNDVYHQDTFEARMREIIEFSIENGVIPILSTKADNLEGDGSINATIARLAMEYQVPLWNFWRAVQPLPSQGLQEDGAHLTRAGNHFDDPNAMQTAWTVRNLNALQVLDIVWQNINEAATD